MNRVFLMAVVGMITKTTGMRVTLAGAVRMNSGGGLGGNDSRRQQRDLSSVLERSRNIAIDSLGIAQEVGLETTFRRTAVAQQALLMTLLELSREFPLQTFSTWKREWSVLPTGPSQTSRVVVTPE